MKIIVISDSHGYEMNIGKVLEMHADAELLIHLGDGIDDLKRYRPNYPNMEFLSSNGNKEDGALSISNSLPFNVIEAAGKRILYCHGHRLCVNAGLSRLFYTAAEQSADIALFGHTHVKHNEYRPIVSGENDGKGIYLFNPGSITLPRDCLTPSFGLLEIRENGVLLSHGMLRRKGMTV